MTPPLWRLVHVSGANNLPPGYVHGKRSCVPENGGASAQEEYTWLLRYIGGNWRAELVTDA